MQGDADERGNVEVAMKMVCAGFFANQRGTMDAKLEVPKTAFSRAGHLLPSLRRKLYLIAFGTDYRQWKGMLPKLRLDIVANDSLILST